MILNEEYVLNIEKLINEGKGLARLSGLPVFVDNVCPGDVIRAKIVNINKKYLKAEISEIITPSKYRVNPSCRLHKICGSCNWQHIAYEKQLEEKRNIVKETIKNISGIDIEPENTIPSPKVSEYRCKVQFPVSQKKSGRIISGYYKKSSHELINIKYCPMQSALINKIAEYIKDEAQRLNISGYQEKQHTGLIRHVVFRQSSDCKSLLVILVLNSDSIDKKITNLANGLMAEFPEIKGVCANLNTAKTNVILSDKTVCVKGNNFYVESLSKKQYKISANSFFQVNPLCAEKIFDIVKDLITQKISSPSILDAYSGVSSFGIWLSDIASKVVCVEEVVAASQDAKENVRLNNCDNVEIINGDAGKKFKEFIDNKMLFDVVVIDPPRKGCSEDAINNVVSLTGRYLIYVSCNPATLARDLKTLIENSFKPLTVQPVDMFPNTYHVETVVLLEKQQ